MIEHKYLDLLKEFNTDENPHTNRTLSNHLIGTYELLEKWDNTKEICLAGLFHSIYGTRVYKISSIDFSKRKYIESIIGKRAEELVYLFCVTDRREDGNLIEKNQIILKDIIHNKEIHISKNDLYALIEIEFANVLEQSVHLNTNEKWILNFKDKFNKTKNYISIKSYKDLEKFLINILPKSIENKESLNLLMQNLY